NTLICERIKNFAPKLYSMFCSPGAGQRLYFVRMSLVAGRYNYSALMARYPVNDDCNANNKKPRGECGLKPVFRWLGIVGNNPTLIKRWVNIP
ncbi:hypothetical protein, partial [Cronobacter sakazakii]|uniref:hypothetical protein n=1 Tax=Cronobacter sakazakii TaxID=28141 RepID=UPI001F44CFC3